MTTRCLLVCENDFVIAGVNSLLAGQTDLEVYTINSIAETELDHSIQMVHPDVVILDEGVRTIPPAQLRKLLIVWPNLRLIILNHEDNVVRIFQAQGSGEAHVRDLDQVIRRQKPDIRFI